MAKKVLVNLVGNASFVHLLDHARCKVITFWTDNRAQGSWERIPMAHRTTRKANVDYVISPVKPPPLKRAKADPVSESPVDSDKLPYKRNQYHQNAAALCKLPSPNTAARHVPSFLKYVRYWDYPTLYVMIYKTCLNLVLSQNTQMTG
jgi:hypothetical protein